jgi:beta-galactosidase
VGNTYIGDVFPCRERFPGLPHPPFVVGKELAGLWGTKWKPLKIEGYLNGQLVITRELANTGLDTCFEVFADDTELVGDGSDATRVWFRVTDEYHNPRNFAIGAIQFKIEGPGEIIGDNPFPLIGGCGAIWVRSRPASGTAVLEVTHPYLGTQLITIQVTPEQIEEI